MKKLTLLFLMFMLHSASAQWVNHQSAEFVIGQPNFNTYGSTGGMSGFYEPPHCAIDYLHNKLYVCDYYDRVLRFSYPITSNYPAAEMYFGTGVKGSSQNQLNMPIAVAVHEGTLWISDAPNNRILKFNNAWSIAANSPPADGVLGQTNFTSKTAGTTRSTFNFPLNIFIDEYGNLWVPDLNNNRVLKFNNVNTKLNGADADLVLGQPDFSTNDALTTQEGFIGPSGVCYAGNILWVSDQGSNRILRFNNPAVNGTPANAVLGQSAFTTSDAGSGASRFSTPNNVCVDPAGRLYVADWGNHRVLIFNNASSKTNGAPADNVIGQINFDITAAGYGQTGFNGAINVTIDPVNNKLLVCDYWLNRILVFSGSIPLPVELNCFSAQQNGSSAVLKWKTASEINNYGFEIERTKEETQNWEKIGFIAGHGNSSSCHEYAFTDPSPLLGNARYRLKQIDNDGKFHYSDAVSLFFDAPREFKLFQNNPNPFNPSTAISFQIPANASVTLKIYDILGSEVSTVIDEEKPAGTYTISWNGKNNTGEPAPGGIYIYKLTAGNYSESKKMILLR